MEILRRWLVPSLIGLLAAWALPGLVGCSKNGDFEWRDQIQVLKDGQADGHLTMSMGGSPFSLGMKQIFFAGPENASFAFDGDIDFGNVVPQVVVHRIETDEPLPTGEPPGAPD